MAQKPKSIYVTVALCDNKYQWIQKVPAELGNGQQPSKNLYWGALYGMKTYFKRQPEWELVKTDKNVTFPVLERLIFKNKKYNAYMIVDAYDGKYIKDTIVDFMEYAAGNKSFAIKAGDTVIYTGGASELVVYVGHNGLMDFSIPETLQKNKSLVKDAAVFACKSKSYFQDKLKKLNVVPIVTTTGLMAPEAYNVHALVNSWLDGKSSVEIRDSVAAAYHKYQKCGINASKKLFHYE